MLDTAPLESEFNLLFERFLHVELGSQPNILTALENYEFVASFDGPTKSKLNLSTTLKGHKRRKINDSLVRQE